MPMHPSIWHVKLLHKRTFTRKYHIALTKTESLMYHYTLEDGNPDCTWHFFITPNHLSSN